MNTDARSGFNKTPKRTTVLFSREGLLTKLWKTGAFVLLALKLSGCASLSGTQTPVFQAHDGAIYTPGGRPFIARGVNLQYGDNPALTLPAIGAIHGVGANIVRLQLRRNTTAEELRAALDEAVKYKIPVMAFYWESDITCGRDSTLLRRDTEALWLGRWADVLMQAKYQPYLMLNIANEWGTSDNDYSDYLDTYVDLIEAMRARGFRVPIVIDAAHCGQATGSFLEGRGQALYDADPLRNLIVSVHPYHHLWNSPEKIDRNISDLKAAGVPFLFGEFGDRELVENGNSVDHLHLMRAAKEKGVGWIVWSWKGNGTATRVLDMSTDYGKAELTRRGEDIVNAPGGLRDGK